MLFLVGTVAVAQQSVRPDWFFNEDCKNIHSFLNRIRQSPTGEELEKYKIVSTNKSPLVMDYRLGEIIKNNAPAYPYTDNNEYNKIDFAWKLSGNGFTYQSVIDMLLDNPEVANAILNTTSSPKTA